MACLRVISHDDTSGGLFRQDIYLKLCLREKRETSSPETGLSAVLPRTAGLEARFCSIQHAEQSRPHENKEVSSGILRRKVASQIPIRSTSPTLTSSLRRS